MNFRPMKLPGVPLKTILPAVQIPKAKAPCSTCAKIRAAAASLTRKALRR